MSNGSSKKEGAPLGGPSSPEVPKPSKEGVEEIKEEKLSTETAAPKAEKLEEDIEKKKEEEKEKINEALRAVFFKAQDLERDIVIGKIKEPEAKAKLKEFIKGQSKIQEYISGEDRRIALDAWRYGWKRSEDEFISWAMRIFSRKISERIELKFPVKKPEEKEEKPEIVKPEGEIAKPERPPEVGYISRVAREAYEKGEEDVQRQQIAESNKEFLSKFAPNKTEKEVFEQFLDKWKTIQDIKEEVDIEREIVDSITSAIEDAIRWRDLSAFRSNLEKFKKIFEDYKLEKKKSRGEI